MRFILIAYDSTKQDKQNRKICGSESHGRKGRTRTVTDCSSVLFQRTKTLPCGRENVKKESDVN